MKHVILALLILIAVQPVQASLCAMDMHMGDMNAVMDHAMQPAPDADCCDHNGPDSSRSCNSLSYCGTAPAGAAVLTAGLDFVTTYMVGRLPSFNNGALTPSFDSPLYRPPIS